MAIPTDTQIMGSGFTPPTFDAKNVVTTPGWIVMIDDFLSSTIKGSTPDPTPNPGPNIEFTKCAMLFGFKDSESRLTKGTAGHERSSTASVVHDQVMIVIQSGKYVPDLKNLMYSGTVAKKIHLVNLNNIQQTNQAVQIISYVTANIENVQQTQNVDGSALVVIYFRPAIKVDTFIPYDQVDGRPEGRTASGFDYTTGKMIEVSGG